MLEDRIYVHQALATKLVLSEPEDDLSAREREVLRLIALGYTNQEIAKQMYLSVRTVEAHRRHILEQAPAGDARRSGALRAGAPAPADRLTRRAAAFPQPPR